MDETILPTEEIFEAAFNFHRKKLFHLCYGYLETLKFPLINSILNYRAWVQYYLLVREENEVMLQKLQRA